MRPGKKSSIVTLIVIVHLLILVSVSDIIYFSSPIDDDIPSVEPSTDSPPAKRLVLFLTDRLATDSYFPLFLSKITHNGGSWGMAHSKFSALERSIHVAVLTGTYENPVASIVNDWFARPVDADSLIKQSRHTWYWGKVKVLKQFNRDKLAHVHITTCSSNYNKKLLSNQINSFLKKNKYRISLRSNIFNENGCIFLIHLPEVKALDKVVEDIYKSFRKAFVDNATAFALTISTSWGARRYDTGTAFIAWGAGIKRNLKRIDLKQTDIAPLLASLIGVSIPVNSLGVVPLRYLNLTKEESVSELATNALQLSKLFEASRRQVEARSLNFQPYKHLNSTSLTDRFAHLKYMHFSSSYATVMEDCLKLIDDLLEGIVYYQTYFTTLVVSCVLIGYLLLIVFFVGRMFDDKVDSGSCPYPLGVVILVSIYLSCVKSWSWCYYVYPIFPLLMLCAVFPFLRRIVSKFSRYTLSVSVIGWRLKLIYLMKVNL